jgi:CubicO group peptidase (beta-lactamase class C family)
MDARIARAIQCCLDRHKEARPARLAVVATLAGRRADVAAFARAGATLLPALGSRFLLYSVTKTVLAAALLRFVARGHLDLDSGLERWLPELPTAARLTPRAVLAHVSGLPDYGGLLEYHAAVRAGEPPWTEAEFLRRTGADRSLGPAGGFAYSNIGYMLIRLVLTRMGDADLATVLRREILDPLGIETASVPTSRSDLADFVFGPSHYLGGQDAPANVATAYHPGWVAHGVIGASMADAARLLEEILTSSLTRPLRAQMMRPAFRFPEAFANGPFRQPAYGLGLMMDLDRSCGPLYGHTGGGPGSFVAVYSFPCRRPRLTVAVAIDGGDAGLAERIVLAAAGSDP